MEPISRKELETFIGSKATTPFYTKSLNIYMDNPNKPMWCWPAAIVNVFWFGFRRAATPMLLLFAAYFSLFFLTMFMPTFAPPLLLIIVILCGLFGMNIYLDYAVKEITKIKDNHAGLSDEKILEAIAKKGGVSYKAPVLLYIVFAAVLIAVISLLQNS